MTTRQLLLPILLAILLAPPAPAQQLHSASTPVLPHKTVDVRNSVYDLLDYYQSNGVLEFLPQAKPYTNSLIFSYLQELQASEKLTEQEKQVVRKYLIDFSRYVNCFIVKDQHTENRFAAVGYAASLDAKLAGGDDGTYATSGIFEPFVAGQLGDHITVFGALGLGLERLAPDIFYESYVKNGAVHFPYQDKGYAHHPYQFDYETMYDHPDVDASSGGGNALHKNFTAAMLYHAELSGSWYHNAIRFSFHNNRRTWGYQPDNLTLSTHARRMPGLDLVIEPAKWLRYSMLVASTFHYANQRSGYKQDIYGYDLGDVQKMLTLQMVELTPLPWLQIAVTGGNIWSKRLELAYMMPFAFPHFTQIDVGDHDNLFMGLNLAVKIPRAGKAWFNLLIDEFSFINRSQPLLKMPRNRYAWQVGWDLPLPLPLTIARVSYTRVTPFVYTHYPETNFNTLSTRPLDMTYTHDGANIGFYLPPNSSELKINLSTLAFPDFKIELDTRYIIHGTNDLAGDTLQIFGDVYRHQFGGAEKYPLLDFTKDGLYDYTFFTQLSAEYRMRKGDGLGYYRLIGKVGYSDTWWESNDSGVAAPASMKLFSINVGLSVDF